MRTSTLAAMITAMMVSPAAVKAQDAVLIERGKAKSQIVVADQPSRVAMDAAMLVQATLRKMSGAELQIVRESTAQIPPAAGQAWIAIGDTRLARSHGIDPTLLKPEEIRVVVTASSVVLVGNEAPNAPVGNTTQQGTYYAAVEFLERLGVRWLWPGESGEVIPRRVTVEQSALDYAFAPKLFQRHLRFAVRDQAAAEFKYGVRMDEAGLRPGDWPDKMRLGHSRPVSAGHGFGDWYERYFKEHPEYFAVGEDGKSYGWMNNPNRSKQCLSNRGTLEQVISSAKAEYSASRYPAATCFSLSPNDNQAGHCMCGNCRTMDALDGPKETWNFYSADGQGARAVRLVQHVSLTDRHVKFWNAVAERLEPECPGLLFGAYAYGVYRRPPLHVAARPSILIGYVGGSYTNDALRRDCLAQWDAWAQKADKLMFRPNLMKEGYGFPLLWPARMAEDIRHFADRKLVAADIPNIHGHWATQGLN